MKNNELRLCGGLLEYKYNIFYKIFFRKKWKAELEESARRREEFYKTHLPIVLINPNPPGDGDVIYVAK